MSLSHKTHKPQSAYMMDTTQTNGALAPYNYHLLGKLSYCKREFLMSCFLRLIENMKEVGTKAASCHASRQ